MPGIAEWIQGHFKIPHAEYRELAKQFNPTQFDAGFVARLAREAGTKYLVISAKHHDGFAMFDSRCDDFNIVKASPYGRDPMKDLAEACAREGIVFFFYHSRDLDWAHPDGGGNTWDYAPDTKVFDRYLEQKCKPQLRELLTQYGRIGLIWFDMSTNISAEQSREVAELVHELQPQCLVSGRVGHNMGDYGCLGDNQIAAAVAEAANERNQVDRLHADLGGLTRIWFLTDDWISWEFLVVRPGVYRVDLHTVAAKYEPWVGGHVAEVRRLNQVLAGPVTADRRIESHRTTHFEEAATTLGVLKVDRTGRHTLELRARAISPAVKNGFCVSEVAIDPTSAG
jgi:hypothetical protein